MRRSPEEEEFCATRGRLKAKLSYEKPLKGNPVLRCPSEEESVLRGPTRGSPSNGPSAGEDSVPRATVEEDSVLRAPLKALS